MKKSKVIQIFRQILITLVVFSLICPGGLWAGRVKLGARLIVKMEDGRSVVGGLIKVEEESLLLLDFESLAKVSIGVQEVDKIWVKKKSGFVIGLMVGFVGGGAAGFATGYLPLHSARKKISSYIFRPDFLGTIFGIIGAIAGLVILGNAGKKRSSNFKLYQVKGKSPDEIKMILKKLRKRARDRK